jgi:hypothetical protein
MEFIVLLVQVVSRKGAKETKAQRGFSLERKWGLTQRRRERRDKGERNKLFHRHENE